MTSRLLPQMQNKIAVELAPVAGMGFCWAWTGALNSRGYGCVGVNKKSQLTHRVAYQCYRGPIPAGLQIDHLCGNKRCCNPDHLEAVTAKVNIRRTDRVNKTHCVKGHRLDDANVIEKVARGYVIRNCRTCDIARKRAARASA